MSADCTTLFDISASQELVDEVFNHSALYPSMHKYKNKEKLEKRRDEIKNLFPTVKSESRKQRLKNEVLIITGKIFVLEMKNSGPLGYFKWFTANLEEKCWLGSSKLTDEEKKDKKKSLAKVTALYFHTGKLVREKGRQIASEKK